MSPDKLKAADKSLRYWLDWLLAGGNAYVTFDHAIGGLPPKLRGAKAPGLPHSCWELLEHIRIAQWDILDFSRNPNYEQRPWPEGYWPRNAAPKKGEWEKCVRQCRADRRAIRKMIKDPRTDLHAPLPWDKDKTVLREVLLLADHNTYHLGQLVLVRKALGAWKE